MKVVKFYNFVASEGFSCRGPPIYPSMNVDHKEKRCAFLSKEKKWRLIELADKETDSQNVTSS